MACQCLCPFRTERPKGEIKHLSKERYRYLTRWRMHMATRLLKNDVQMGKIAQQLGYASEVAFRKALKREVGMPPARYRKQR